MNRYTTSKALKKQVKKFGYSPKMWNHNIRTNAGLVDNNAISILRWVRDRYIEGNFDGEWLQTCYAELMDETGLTAKQVKDTLRRLRDSNLIIEPIERVNYGSGFATDIWLIPCVKKMNRAAATKIRRRQRHVKHQYTNLELCVLVAKKTKTPVHYYMGQNCPIIETTLLSNDKSQGVFGTRVIRRKKLLNLFYKYKNNFVIQLAILTSYPWLKKYIMEDITANRLLAGQQHGNKFKAIKDSVVLSSVTDKDLEDIFAQIWAGYKHPRDVSRYYQDQLYASYPALAAAAELGAAHGKDASWVASFILDNQYEISKQYVFGNRRGAGGKLISYWLTDCQDIIIKKMEDSLCEKGFWER